MDPIPVASFTGQPTTSIASSRARSRQPTGAGTDQIRVVVKLKAAKALGIEVTDNPARRANEVIE
jgi:hypothetical protein